MAIRNKAAAMQYIEYCNLAVDENYNFNQKGRYHGMDLDYCLHFVKRSHPGMNFERAVLFVEFKREESCKMPVGEKITYTDIADCIAGCNGLAVIALAYHNVDWKDGDVDGSKAIVKEFYIANIKEWHTFKRDVTVKEFEAMFLTTAGLKKGGNHNGNGR